MITHIITAFTFGLNPIIYKVLQNYKINNISIIFIMVLLSFLISIPYLLYNNNYKIIINDINNIKKNNDFSIIGLLFIFVTLIYLICQYNYIVSLNSDEYKLAISVAIISCYPTITLILSYLLFNEIITLKQFIGIIIVIIGLFLLI